MCCFVKKFSTTLVELHSNAVKVPTAVSGVSDSFSNMVFALWDCHACGSQWLWFIFFKFFISNILSKKATKKTHLIGGRMLRNHTSNKMARRFRAKALSHRHPLEQERSRYKPTYRKYCDLYACEGFSRPETVLSVLNLLYYKQT